MAAGPVGVVAHEAAAFFIIVVGARIMFVAGEEGRRGAGGGGFFVGGNGEVFVFVRLLIWHCGWRPRGPGIGRAAVRWVVVRREKGYFVPDCGIEMYDASMELVLELVRVLVI